MAKLCYINVITAAYCEELLLKFQLLFRVSLVI